MVLSVMIGNGGAPADNRRFRTNGGCRHSRTSAHPLREMRRLGIPGADPPSRTGWLVMLAQIACIRKAGGPMGGVAWEKARRLRDNRTRPSTGPHKQRLKRRLDQSSKGYQQYRDSDTRLLVRLV